MPRPQPESPYRLLVEGLDDLHSIVHLLKRYDFDWDDESKIRPFVSAEGGLARLLDSFTVALKGTYQRLGIVLDANLNLTNRWAQISNRAQKVGVILPSIPQPEGSILPSRQPGSRLGIWIMPDNSSPGALEDFLVKLIAPDDPCLSLATEVVTEARRRGARCHEKDVSKSVLHTWLAWQEKPGLPFGTALEAEILDKSGETPRRFVDWFRRLFIDP